MSDPGPPPFDPDNPHEGWGTITSAYDVASFTGGAPIGIQVILKSGDRVLQTGILAGTEDQLDADGRAKRSVIYFAQAEGVAINWTDVVTVLAMVAEDPNQEAPHDGHD